MKKVLCFLLCAVFIVFAAGCSSNPPLTDKEYCEQLRDNFKNYSALAPGFLTELQNGTYDTSSVDLADSYLTAMEKLSPPEDYKELHKKLCDGIKNEHEVLSIIKEVFEEAKKEGTANVDSVKEKMERMNTLLQDQTFSNAVIDIVKKYAETSGASQ